MVRMALGAVPPEQKVYFKTYRRYVPSRPTAPPHQDFFAPGFGISQVVAPETRALGDLDTRVSFFWTFDQGRDFVRRKVGLVLRQPICHQTLGKGSSGSVFLLHHDKGGSLAVKSSRRDCTRELEILRSLAVSQSVNTCSLVASFTCHVPIQGFNRFRRALPPLRLGPPDNGSVTSMLLSTVVRCPNSNKKLKDITTPEIVDYFRQLFTALQCLHRQSICHNDIKERNILYCFETRKFLLIDFSNASREGEKDCLQPGTPGLESPEQALQCRSQFSTKSDIYTSGVLLLRFLLRGNILLSPSAVTRDHKRIQGLKLNLQLAGASTLDFLNYCHCRESHHVGQYPVGIGTNICISEVFIGCTLCLDCQLLRVALECLQPSPKSRPTAEDILKNPLFSQGVTC
jgi:serine/threonine protein kinase